MRAAVGAAALALAAGSTAQAQGRLDARYTASLAGLSIGKGAWFIDIGDDKYLAAASGRTAGILSLFSSGGGTGAARGSVINGRLMPASYSASISTSKRKNEVRITLKAGAVKDLDVSPPVSPDSGRVPLRAAHRRGVIDPMSASLMRVASGADPLAPGTCRRKVSIFDGRMRYDLHLAYKRKEQVKAEKGYAGPALVCAVYFHPIAGHVPDRAAIRYLAKSRDVEAWMVPIAGTDILVPFRVSVPTPFGLGVVQATQFVTATRRAQTTTSGVRSR